MHEELRVSIIQSNLIWESPEDNRNLFSEKINAISEETELIVLPEMFTTGFTMNASSLAEEEKGDTLIWMQNEAQKNNCAITGSIIIKDKGSYYNRLLFVFPNGEYNVYNKRHTFTLAGEHHTYASGNDRLIIEYLGWKICPLICYDLRFPVWARNNQGYDIILYVANWPKKRVSAWDALLKARAIENMSFCIGVNRVGEDANAHEYIGHSAIYDVLGKQISSLDYEKSFTQTISLSKAHIEKHRNHLQFLKDQDYFTL